MEEELPMFDKARRKSLFQAAKLLTKSSIEDRLENLAPSVNNRLVFIELDLSEMRLTNIDAISEFIHLQILKLRHNNLTNMSALDTLTNLIYLDVSHNRNHKLFDFTAPNNLREANYAHNFVSTIPVLASFWTLTKLNLDYNNIRRISYGLLFCTHLTYLSIKGNDIKFIDNLQNLPLRVLILADNDISEITCIETLVYLEVLDLSQNNIRRLNGVQGHYYLNNVDMSENEISTLSEFAVLEKLPTLRTLNLKDNPVCENRLYKNIVLATQPSLLILDGRQLSITEKIKAISQIRPRRDILSIRDRFINSVYNFLQPLKVRPSTSSERLLHYPFLVLLGPVGSLKSTLLTRVVEDFPHFWKKAVSHTTRSTRKTENKGKYHFINTRQFEFLHQSGNFIQTTNLYGEHYGLSWGTVDEIAKKKLYPIAHMELEAVLTLQLTHFRLYLIVVMPHDVTIHRIRLETVLGLNEITVDEALDRRSVYMEYYNVDSGLFTLHVNADNLEAAYKQLKEMVINIQNEIIADRQETMQSILQWKPTKACDLYNNTEVASLQYRIERSRDAFVHNRVGRLFPKSHQLDVLISEEQDFNSTPKSEFSS